MYKQFTIVLALVLLLTDYTLIAQWSSDPAVNTPVCTLVSEQGYPAVTSDGSGGSIIVWDDWRNGGNANHDIYAQRLNAAGVALWTPDGVPVCTEENTIANPVVISDGTGGAIVAWVDMRNNATTNYDIYAQRIDAAGTILWAADGVVICSDAGSQYNPAITSDGNGGAVVTWWDLRNGMFNADIYAQKVNAAGIVLWTADGVAVCTEPDEQRYPVITGDGSNGALISWQDYTNNDIYAQHVDTDGMVMWSAGGVAVCTQPGAQFNPTIASDGSGGSIIAWWDNRNGNWDIYAQRMHSAGSSLWTVNGVPVSVQGNDQQSPSITDDGNGGAIIAWVDARNGSGGGYSDIYAQRLNSGGSPMWASDAEVSANVGSQYLPAIVHTGGGNSVAVWYDYRNNNNDIFAARISPDGTLPVEITAFTAVQTNGAGVEVHWVTATELNNHGFEIQRSAVSAPPSVPDNRQADAGRGLWQKAGFVEGNGTSNAPHEYRFTDRSVNAGRYLYRLKQIDRDGNFSYSSEVEVTLGSVPKVFAIEQNYPNPFNPNTTIGFTLQVSGPTTLKIFDAVGREVAMLVDENLEAGVYHQKQFDAAKLASGIYFAALSSGGKIQIRKLMVIK